MAQRIANPHVREVCYDLAVECAESTGIFPNRFFFAHGYQRSVESRKGRKEVFLAVDPTVIIPSEVVHQGDLYAIWDYSVSWRETDVTFEDFVAMRRILKSDWFELGLFMGKQFEEKPHRGWAEFLPVFTPSLPPNYTQEEMRQWLIKQQSPTHPATTRDFLLQASRNSFKSSVGLIFLTQAILCAPSLRLLLVSETTKLSRAFIKAFRGIWEVGHEKNRFQCWFPEYCVPQGEGSILAFESPMRHLLLAQDTASAASLEMAMAGQRFDIGWFDDVISNMNTGNDEMREKGLNTYDALLKLREVGSGIAITIGTPWVPPPPDGIGDLYFELMKRNKLDPEHPLAVKVEPAWILKPESQFKVPDYIQTVTEDDVQELAFPSRLTFRFLMKESRANLPLFLSQNLCMYVESAESKWTPTFTMQGLYAKVKPLGFFDKYPTLRTVAAVDTAFSQAMTADRSSICIAAIKQFEGKNVAVILDIIADRWKYSDLGQKIVEAFQKHGVQFAVIERNGPWEDLQASVLRNAIIRNCILPQIIWKVSKGSGIGIPAKVIRIKGAETFLNNNQLYFEQGAWNEPLFNETVKFNGQRSNITRKDDQVDSLGMLTDAFLVKDTGGVQAPTEEQMQMEREARNREHIKAQHARIFGIPKHRSTTAQFTRHHPKTTGHFTAR